MSSNSDLVKWIAGSATAALVCAGLLFLRKGPQTGGSSAMGGPSSLHPSLNREDDKINDSVWELYSPKGKPAVEIIFFHGLQLGNFEDAFWSTWLATDGSTIWPKEWLPDKCNGPARVLSVSYNSSATQIDGQNDMYLLGENLVADIINERKLDIGQNCPVFLVGHCLGGIVIKEFIVFTVQNARSQLDPRKDRKAINRINRFLGNFKGALFYGTPHAGSEQIELLAKRLSSKSPLLKLMKVLATDTARINGSFRQIRSNLDAKILAIGEGLETKTNGFNGMVVVEASARNDVNEYCTHTKADHFTVCKARHKKDPTVIEKLAQFINSTLEETSRQQAHALVTR